GSAFELTRAGRILLVSSGEGAVHALDITSGDELWRLARDTRFTSAAAVVGDRAFVVSNGGEDGPGALCGVALFSGELTARVALDAAPLGAPLAAGGHVLVATSAGVGALS